MPFSRQAYRLSIRAQESFARAIGNLSRIIEGAVGLQLQFAQRPTLAAMR
jgi:hypothetical protein